MHQALRSRGFVDGRDLDYLAVPRATHSEEAWSMRAHIPIQRFFSPTASTNRKKVKPLRAVAI